MTGEDDDGDEDEQEEFEEEAWLKAYDTDTLDRFNQVMVEAARQHLGYM